MSLVIQQAMLEQYAAGLQHRLLLQKEAFGPPRCGATPSTSGGCSPRSATSEMPSIAPPPGSEELAGRLCSSFDVVCDLGLEERPASSFCSAHTSALSTLPQPRFDSTRAAPGLVAPQVHSEEWIIQHVFSRLRSSCGFPLPSPSMSARATGGTIGELNFQFIPGAAWAAAARGNKDSWGAGVRASCRKDQIQCRAGRGSPEQHRASDESDTGPVNGALRIKLLSGSSASAFRLFFFVGSFRHGPVDCDFSERAVCEVPFEVDWRKELVNDSSLSFDFQFLVYA